MELAKLTTERLEKEGFRVLHEADGKEACPRLTVRWVSGNTRDNQSFALFCPLCHLLRTSQLTAYLLCTFKHFLHYLVRIVF